MTKIRSDAEVEHEPLWNNSVNAKILFENQNKGSKI
jgi:hypothetical protein